MAVFLLLLLFGDGARPDLPGPKPELRRYGDPMPLPKLPPTPQPKPKKETAAERRKRLAEEKQQQQQMRAILKVLGSENSGTRLGLIGVLQADPPNLVGASPFGPSLGSLGGVTPSTPPPPPVND